MMEVFIELKRPPFDECILYNSKFKALNFADVLMIFRWNSNMISNFDE